jgi:hypothetical protein
LRGTQGIAYDPVNDLIALATNRGAGLGAIVLFDPTTKTVVDEFNFGATTNTDVAFDNVGNLYVGNRSAEFVHVWSPPNGPAASKTYADNQFSTDSLGPLGAIALTAATGLQGDFNHDNVVNGADFLIWQRNLGQTGQTNNNNGDANGNGSVDLADLTIWKTSFGQTSSSGAAGAVPEPASLVLLVGAAACGCLNRRRTR